MAPMTWVTLYSIFSVLLIYVTYVILYRLFLSPLAKFPGPRLAAVTGFYETYFDIVKGGKFTWEINRLHQKYGSVVRVSPVELHVDDPDFYDILYSGPTQKRNKDPWFTYIGLPKSVFSTPTYALHRTRRSMLSQFFTKKAISDFEPVIHAKIQSLCNHFSRAAKSGNTLELHACFMCFTCDTLSQHAFGDLSCFHYLDQQELTTDWKKKINGCFELVRLVRHFPWLSPLAHVLPTLAGRICQNFSYVTQREMEVRNVIRRALSHEQQNELECKQQNKSIYPMIIRNEKISPSEKELNRLADDANFLMIAGTDAPSQALTITMFQILRHPETYRRIKVELRSVTPDARGNLSLEALEQLPYFNAALKESLRLSAIVTTRLPRISPDQVLQYHNWQIPPGTPVSMSTHFILRNPRIFPEPLRFVPERWMLPTDKLQKLEKYLVPFSKGTFGCLGPNMTHAWLHLVLGTLLRRFEFTLYDTTEENVEMTRDCFIGQTEPGMNVVQVKVLKEHC